MTKVESIDYLADVKNMLTETEKLELLYKTGQMDFNQIRYFPGLINIADQGQIYSLQTKEKYASERYYQKNNLELKLPYLQRNTRILITYSFVFQQN